VQEQRHLTISLGEFTKDFTPEEQAAGCFAFDWMSGRTLAFSPKYCVRMSTARQGKF
jgi:hypothetical protein